MCATPARHRAPRNNVSAAEQRFWAASSLVESGQARWVDRVREGSSRYAVHIGRVGALAVSLGVGLAIANSAGVALADSESAESSAASTKDSGSSANGSADTSASPQGSGASQSSVDGGSATDTGSTDSADDDAADAAESGGADDDASDGSSEPSTDGGSSSGSSADDESSAAEDTGVSTDPESSAGGAGGAASDVNLQDVVSLPSGSSGGSSESGGRAPAGSESESAPSDDDEQVSAGEQLAVDAVEKAEAESGDVTGSAEDTSVQVQSAVLTSSADVPQMVAAPADQAISVVTGLTSALLAPVGAPAAPAASPVTDLFLAYVRRILNHTFLNKTPIAGPIVTELPIPAGARTFEINASDPNGDLLSYTIVQPEHGIVTQVPFTSKFIYTPKTLIVTGETLVDSFQVIVKDSTLQHLPGTLGKIQKLLHDISKFFGIAKKDDLVVTVPVVIEPLHFAPVVVTAGTPFHVIGDPPVTLLSSASISDVDSANLSGATLKITTLAQDGDELGYNGSGPITGSWDAGTKTLTLTGEASKADYETALESVTFSATGGVLIPRTVEIRVTDTDDETSLIPGLAIANARYSLPPTVTTVGTPTFTLEGPPVTVLSSATISDLDSDDLSGATVVIGTLAQAGDVLSYSGPLTASWDAGSFTLTLSGVASKADYEAALESITFTATQGPLLVRGIGFTVTDASGVDSLLPGAALVNVLPAVHLPPTVTTVGAPTFTLEGPPVTVLSSATISDLDSTMLSGATVVIGTLAQAGDVLSYSGPLTATWDAGSFTLTLSGAASLDDYETALESITFTATQGAGLIRGIGFTVTDDDGVDSLLPGAALVNVLPAVHLPPTVTTVGAPTFTLEGPPVTVLSSATISDLDSTMLSGATVVIGTLAQAGDVLSYSGPLTATWDAGSFTLTLSGAASLDDYETALESITFSATQGAGLIRGIGFTVTDDDGVDSLLPGAALVNVAPAIHLPPTVTTVGTPTFTLEGPPVTVLSSATISDLDSTMLSGATVVIGTLAQAGDVLSYSGPLTATWDAGSFTLTLSGAASLDDYETALESITFSATQGAGLIRGIGFTVTDDDGVDSLLPGAALVNVAPAIHLPPTVTTVGTPTFTLEGPPVTVLSSATISDLDSTMLSGATVVIGTLAQAGDVLSYSGPLTATWDAGSFTLTLSGAASLDDYETALESITFSATGGALLTRGIGFTVTDDDGVDSLLPGAALVNVAPAIHLPPTVTTVGVAMHTIGTPPVTLLSSATISDLDSDDLSGATVKIVTLAQAGDVLSYSGPLTATWDGGTFTLTLTGAASKADYETALESVTFSATGGVAIPRGIAVTVTDDDGVDSLVPGAATANSRYSLAPTVTTVGVAMHTIGTPPVTLLSSATISDLDSDDLSGATVKIVTLAQAGDVLSYSGPLTATWDGGTFTLTLTGAASKADYETALESVTFSATGGVAIPRGISITVTDDAGVTSVIPGAATANSRYSLLPVVTAGGSKTYKLGNAPINPLWAVTVTDADSAIMSEATVRIWSGYHVGDVLSYVAPVGNPVTASWDLATKTLKLSGAATKAQYVAALEAVGFSSSASGLGGLGIRSLEIKVKDDAGMTSLAVSADVLTSLI